MRKPTSNAATSRKTQPSGYNPFAAGGVAGQVVNRGGSLYGCGHDGSFGAWDLTTQEGLGRFLRLNAPRLAKSLPEWEPTADYTLHTVRQLACTPGDCGITAVKKGAKGDEPDPEGTALLDGLWDRLSAYIGGFNGLFTILFDEAQRTGLAFVEAVPGPRDQGIVQVWPVDSLTIRFARDEDGHFVPQQRQLNGPTGKTDPDGYVRLDPETCFWSAINREVDNPYGRGRFSSGLSDAIAYVRMLQDSRDAFHMTGHARYWQSFPLEEMMQFAMLPVDPSTEGGKTGMGLTYDEALDWITAERATAFSTLGTLIADDAMLVNKGGEVKVLEGAKGASGSDKTLTFHRQRLSQAYKIPGVFLGISDGDTETQAIRQLELFAAGVATERAHVMECLWKIAALELRLHGSDSRPSAWFKPIRAVDALSQAQRDSQVRTNEFELAFAGLRSIEDVSERLTGSAPADADKAKAYFTQATVATTDVTAKPKAQTFSFPKGDKAA